MGLGLPGSVGKQSPPPSLPFAASPDLMASQENASEHALELSGRRKD